MKTYFILLLVLLSGCATAIPVSNHEVCSRDDLALAGTNLTTDSILATDFRGNYVGANGRSNGTNCGRPVSQEEMCKVSGYKASVAIKDEYNQAVPMQRLLTGGGYVLYVVPGVVLYTVYNKDRLTTQGRAIETGESVAQQCLKERGLIKPISLSNISEK